MNAEISPDCRWIAYQSNESGKDEVYVRPFPAVESSRWQISTGGGATPMWSRDSREIFYAGGPLGLTLLRVAVESTPPGGPFSFGGAQPLFSLAPYYSSTGRTLNVSPDGKRFLAIKVPEAGKQQDTIIVVSHWFNELKARVPIK